MKYWYVLLVGIATSVGVVWASFDPVFEDNFVQKENIVGALCHSAFAYGMQEDFQSVKESHHKHMECLVDDVFMRLETDGTYETPESCEGLTLVEIQSQQRRNGMDTQCDDTANVSYGVCRVTETLLGELCAYDMYLWAKGEEDVIGSRRDGSVQQDQAEQRFEVYSEKDRAKQTIREIVELYRHYKRSKELSDMVQDENIEMEDVAGRFEKVSRGIQTFPDKFIPAPTLQR